MNTIDLVSRECFRSFAVLPGAHLFDRDGVFGVMTGVPLTFFNGIATASVRRDDVAGVIETFRRNGRGFRWWISPATEPRDLPEILVQHGMQYVYESTGMKADLAALRGPVATPHDFTIARVTELGAWLHVFLAGFQRPPDEAEVWRDAYAHCDSSWTHFVGFLGDTPVATTSLLVSGELAGVYHVVTLPAFRGQGIGAAMTLAALRHARESGARTAALQSSEMGLSVYRAVGFVEEGPLSLYDWRP